MNNNEQLVLIPTKKPNGVVDIELKYIVNDVQLSVDDLSKETKMYLFGILNTVSSYFKQFIQPDKKYYGD